VITTNGQRIKGTCNGCQIERIYLAATNGDGTGLCAGCYDRAGDENMVSDGHMSCTEFLARYGAHSEYCTGHARTVEFTDAQYTALVAIINAQCTDANDRITSLLSSPKGTIGTLQFLQDERAAVESIREALWAALTPA
jgi:hypothetical protein